MTPRMGSDRPSPGNAASPKDSSERRGSGSDRPSSPKRRRSPASHVRVLMSRSIVRLALETSVANTRPPVSFQTSQASIVPAMSVPDSRACRARDECRTSHASLLAEKYGSSLSPVRSRIVASWPPRASSLQIPTPRSSSQTGALFTGSPVRRSQATMVSRWFVRARQTRSPGSAPAFSTTRSTASTVFLKSSAGSCSTSPAPG